MSEMKVNFNFQNQKIESKFPKDTSIQNILSSFTTKINKIYKCLCLRKL